MSLAKFSCPQCGQHIEYDVKDAGQRIDCPFCKAHLTLPVPASTTPASEPPNQPPKHFSAFTKAYTAAAVGVSVILATILVLTREAQKRHSASQKSKLAASSNRLVQSRTLRLIGTLPDDLTNVTQITSAEATFYHLNDSADDVGQILHRQKVTISNRDRFTVEYSPAAPARDHFRVELLVRSTAFVPLMGRAMFTTNSEAQIQFVPPLRTEDAVLIHGQCVDAQDGTPVPFVGIYLGADKTLTARADEKGRVECFVSSTNGRARVLPWLRKYAGQYRTISVLPGQTNELKIEMRKVAK